MGDVITRKCACCKGTIVIDRNDISNVLQFQDKYYHSDCFEAMATEKAASKRGKPQTWKDVLDHIWELEVETKKMLEHFWAKDDLNEWLLENYDITVIPRRFWQIVAELESGIYKGKKCKPVKTSELYECWKWGQRMLDGVSINNKMNHRGPINDTDRLKYDLAILITKYPLFLKDKAKTMTIESVGNTESKQPKIDYGALNKNKNNDDDNDILDLMDEIF